METHALRRLMAYVGQIVLLLCLSAAGHGLPTVLPALQTHIADAKVLVLSNDIVKNNKSYQ